MGNNDRRGLKEQTRKTPGVRGRLTAKVLGAGRN